MNNLGLKPDVAAYTSLINAHYKARNLKKCWDLWFDVRIGESTTPPDENLFGLMIEICAHVIKIILIRQTHDAERAVNLYKAIEYM